VQTGRVTALSRDGERFAVQIGDRTVSARILTWGNGRQSGAGWNVRAKFFVLDCEPEGEPG
jgi:hypothetical protein